MGGGRLGNSCTESEAQRRHSREEDFEHFLDRLTANWAHGRLLAHSLCTRETGGRVATGEKESVDVAAQANATLAALGLLRRKSREEGREVRLCAAALELEETGDGRGWLEAHHLHRLEQLGVVLDVAHLLLCLCLGCRCCFLAGLL